MNRNTLAGGHMAHKRSPLRSCVCCLYSVGLGIGKIAVIVQRQKAVCFKWVRQHGVLDLLRARRKHPKGSQANRSKPPVDWQKIIMLEYAAEIREVNKADGLWLKHPARAAYCVQQNYNKNKSAINARYKTRWEGDDEWRAKRKAATKLWGKNNQQKKTESFKNWIANNPDKWRLMCRKHRAKPQVKAANNLRKRLRDFLLDGQRIGSTSGLVGCSRAFLNEWLESKFKRGMSWVNYGIDGWHIDHVIPCAKFDLTNPEQQRRCFHYTNLQPLWAEDNIAKSDTMHSAQPELLIAL